MGMAVAVERSRVFEPGLAATIEVNGPEEVFPIRIEEVRADYLLVGTPIQRREYVKLPLGQKLLLSVVRRNNPYFFETTVVGEEWGHGGQHLTVLRRPADNAGVALRATVRVPVTISDGQFWWEGPRGKFGPTTTGHLVDLSAGGMQVVTRTGLPIGVRVLSRFTLSRQLGHLMVDARVLRAYERTSDVGVTSHRAHLQFVDLPAKDRDRLIKFVFQRERELRQKGVL
jgi:c-di-GMP-binding flagellar brake protein YcgR